MKLSFLDFYSFKPFKVMLESCLQSLADLGGHAPPKDPDSFILTYNNFQKITALGVHAPPTRSTPPYGKSWIRH